MKQITKKVLKAKLELLNSLDPDEYFHVSGNQLCRRIGQGYTVLCVGTNRELWKYIDGMEKGLEIFARNIICPRTTY